MPKAPLGHRRPLGLHSLVCSLLPLRTFRPPRPKSGRRGKRTPFRARDNPRLWAVRVRERSFKDATTSVRESVAGRSGKEARAAKQREELRSSSMIEGGLGGARVPPRRSEATHWSEATTAERSDALERSDNKMPRPKAEVQLAERSHGMTSAATLRQ